MTNLLDILSSKGINEIESLSLRVKVCENGYIISCFKALPDEQGNWIPVSSVRIGDNAHGVGKYLRGVIDKWLEDVKNIRTLP